MADVNPYFFDGCWWISVEGQLHKIPEQCENREEAKEAGKRFLDNLQNNNGPIK